MNHVIKSPVLSSPIMGPSDADWSLPSLSRLWWYIVSMKGTAKSTTAASIPTAYVIDAENKFRLIDPQYRKAHGQYISTLKDLEAVIDWLCGDAGKLPFEMVVFDTLEEIMENIIATGLTDLVNSEKVAGKLQLMKPDDPRRVDDIREYKQSPKGSKGWNIFNLYFPNVIRRLRTAGYGGMVLGHTKEETIQVRTPQGVQEVTRYTPAPNRGLLQLLKRPIEVPATIRWITTEVSTPKTITVGDKTITRDEKSNRTVPVLYPNDPIFDGDAITRCNVPLPSQIVLDPLGDAWGCIERAALAYQHPQKENVV